MFSVTRLSRPGNRDIVGYGINGSGSYHDLQVIPMPGVRFKENTPDVLALREKDKGDWRKLTLDEKKACEFVLLRIIVHV